MATTNKIWIMAGQSHMSGIANTNSDLPAKYKSKYLHNARGWDGTTFKVYNSDLDNISIPVAANNRGHLAYYMTDVADFLNEDVYVLHFAIGGVALHEITSQQDYSPNSVGEYYDNVITHINAIKTWMDARDKAYSFEGVIWWQGQYDAGFESLSDFYQTNLQGVYDGWATATGNANLKFYQDNIVNAPSATYVAKATCNGKKLDFTNVDNANRKVYTPNFETWHTDNVHPNVLAMHTDFTNNLLPFIKADL